MFRHYNETKFLASMYMLTMSLFNLMTGIFFITADPRISSPTYSKMQELMPLPSYGLIMLASATFLFSAIFQHGKTSYVFMLLGGRSEEHTSELQSRFDLVCRLLLVN